MNIKALKAFAKQLRKNAIGYDDSYDDGYDDRYDGYDGPSAPHSLTVDINEVEIPHPTDPNLKIIADVVVETSNFSVVGASGDGWNEPREDAYVEDFKIDSITISNCAILDKANDIIDDGIDGQQFEEQFASAVEDKVSEYVNEKYFDSFS